MFTFSCHIFFLFFNFYFLHTNTSFYLISTNRFYNPHFILLHFSFFNFLFHYFLLLSIKLKSKSITLKLKSIVSKQFCSLKARIIFSREISTPSRGFPLQFFLRGSRPLSSHWILFPYQSCPTYKSRSVQGFRGGWGGQQSIRLAFLFKFKQLGCSLCLTRPQCL